MSTANRTTSSSEASLFAQPADVFDSEIFHSREICSQCFARVRERDDYRPDTDGGVSSHAPTERWRRSNDGVKGSVIVDEFDDYSYRPVEEQGLYCGVCGSEYGHYDGSEPLSKHEAANYAYHLGQRLHEKGYDVDIDRLVARVCYYKSRGAATNHDREIFEMAVAVGIRSLKF